MYYIDSIEEVDLAVLEIFRGRKFTRFDGEEKEIRVIYSQPDLDVEEDQNFPVIAVQRTTPYLDRWRMGDSMSPIIYDEEYDEDGNLYSYREARPPIPMKAEYAIRLKYDRESDGAIIISDLMRDLIYGGVLDIKGQQYPFSISFSGIQGTQYKDFGRILDGRRTLEEMMLLVVSYWMNPPKENSDKKYKTVQTIGYRVGIIDGKKRKEDYYYGKRKSDIEESP